MKNVATWIKDNWPDLKKWWILEFVCHINSSGNQDNTRINAMHGEEWDEPSIIQIPDNVVIDHQVFHHLIPQALFRVQEKLTMICTAQHISTYILKRFMHFVVSFAILVHSLDKGGWNNVDIMLFLCQGCWNNIISTIFCPPTPVVISAIIKHERYRGRKFYF